MSLLKSFKTTPSCSVSLAVKLQHSAKHLLNVLCGVNHRYPFRGNGYTNLIYHLLTLNLIIYIKISFCFFFFVDMPEIVR